MIFNVRPEFRCTDNVPTTGKIIIGNDVTVGKMTRRQKRNHLESLIDFQNEFIFLIFCSKLPPALNELKFSWFSDSQCYHNNTKNVRKSTFFDPKYPLFVPKYPKTTNFLALHAQNYSDFEKIHF